MGGGRLPAQGRDLLLQRQRDVLPVQSQGQTRVEQCLDSMLHDKADGVRVALAVAVVALAARS